MDEHLEKAFEFADSLHKKGGLNSFGYYFPSGKTIRWTCQHCYGVLQPERYAAQMPGPFGYEQAMYFVDWSLDRIPHDQLTNPQSRIGGKLGNEDIKRYVSWLVNDSPMADAFPSKSVDDVLYRGAVLDANHCLRMLIHGAMAIRYIYEHSYRITTWNMLVTECNLSGDEAFILCHFLKDVAAGRAYAWGRNVFGHSLLDSVTPPFVRHFLDHKPILYRQKPAWQHPSGYLNLRSIWTSKDASDDMIYRPKGVSIELSTDWRRMVLVDAYPLDWLKENAKTIIEMTRKG